MPRAERAAAPPDPEALARKRGMSVLRGAQQRVAQRPATPTEDRALPGALEMPLDRVLPDPDQPRRDWEHDDGERRLAELADSIREFGVLQPLLVREGGIRPDGTQEYVVIAGGRRRAAAERAGLAAVPVIVRGDEGARVRVLQLLENLQRQQLSPLDEARAFQELIDIEALTPPALAARLKLSDQLIRERLRLLTNQVVADALERKQLNMTAARTLQQLPDAEIGRFKERLQRGEELKHAEIEAHRQRLIAAGVVNPRARGRGRRGPHDEATVQTSFESGSAQQINVQNLGAPPTPDATSPAPPGPAAAAVVQTKFESVSTEAAGVAAADTAAALAVGHPAATTAVARELGAAIWPLLPEALRARVRELADAGPDLAWGAALAEGLTRNLPRIPAGRDAGTGDDAA